MMTTQLGLCLLRIDKLKNEFNFGHTLQEGKRGSKSRNQAVQSTELQPSLGMESTSGTISAQNPTSECLKT
jgi:hypothetical protein